MRRIISCFICLLFGFTAIAQRDTSLTTSVDLTYYVMDLRPIKAKIESYLAKNQIDVISLNEYTRNYNAAFYLNPDAFAEFQKAATEWGQINKQQANSQNHIVQIQEIESDIAFKQQEIDSYEVLLQNLSKENIDYLPLWRKQRSIAEEVHRLEQDKMKLQKKHHNYLIKIKVVEESPDDDYDFALVNMPGVEYAYLDIETPKEGFSASEYHGFFLKYMFTRGKSYGLMGAFKDLSASDTGEIDELFLFGLGQDFYSRYLGRGARKSLNLYSSFNGGYLMATSEETKWRSWYMSAFIGLEIFKTKYLLLDNKIGYFVPFSESRNMRGLSYRVSFNFVF